MPDLSTTASRPARVRADRFIGALRSGTSRGSQDASFLDAISEGVVSERQRSATRTDRAGAEPHSTLVTTLAFSCATRTAAWSVAPWARSSPRCRSSGLWEAR